MTAGGRETTPQVLAFLQVVAAEPSGLCTSWMWREGRGGFGGIAGDAFRECSHRDLVAIRAERFLLTDAGVALLGLADYPAADPSTWPDELAENLYVKGYCHALAVALSRRYGYGLGILVSGRLPLHVFAVEASGEPVDYDGPTSLERMLADCGVKHATFLTLAGEGGLASYIGGHDRLPPMGEGDVSMAMRYIDGRPDKFEPPPAPRP